MKFRIKQESEKCFKVERKELYWGGWHKWEDIAGEFSSLENARAWIKKEKERLRLGYPIYWADERVQEYHD